MTFIFDTRETEAVEPDQISTGPTSDFGENLSASFREARATNLLVSAPTMLERARQERREAIQRVTNQPFEHFMKDRRPEPSVFPDSDMDLVSPEAEVVAELRETLPPDKRDQILTEDGIAQRAKEMALDAVAQNREVSARARGFSGQAGQMLGAIGAELSDPTVLATLPFGASSGARLTVAMGIEAAIAGTVVGAAQPAVQKWRAELGLPSGFAQAAQNVALAAGTTAAFVPVLRVAGKALSSLADRTLLRAHRELLPRPDATQRTARDRLEAELDVEEDTPFEEVPGAAEEHAARGREALAGLDRDGAPAELPGPPPEMARPGRPAYGPPPAAGRPSHLFYNFAPEELGVDAERFQFKSGASSQGVTERLEGVETWDPMRAGIVLVWEDAAGGRWIVDGHQRLALARRIQEADSAQRPRLTGYMLREADEITASQARGIAAAKNMAEGTGTALDAARVLRDAPELASDLPPRSPLVRDAQGLARLSDDAFGMVVNDIVPPGQAALAGRLAPDLPETHGPVLKVLARVKPRNAVEAESVVRDALSAGQVREIQQDLFGAAETTQILYKERAKVLSEAARRIRRDVSAFRTLVREEDRIAEAGNVLVTDVNLRRAQADAETLEIVQRLARRRGPVADALATAAQELKAGGRTGEVVGRFIDAVRRATEGGVEPRRGPGGGGRGGEGVDEGRAPAAGGAERGPVAQAAARAAETGGIGEAADRARIARANAQGFTLEAFHGTRAPEDFDTFDLNRASNFGIEGEQGVAFFTTLPEIAEVFSMGGAGGPGAGRRIIPVRIRPGNSREINLPELIAGKDKEFLDEVEQAYIRRVRSIGRPDEDGRQGFRERMQELGEDIERQMSIRGGPEDVLPPPTVLFDRFMTEALIRMAQRRDLDSVIVRGLSEGGGFESNTIMVFNPANIRSRFDQFLPEAADRTGLLASRQVAESPGARILDPGREAPEPEPPADAAAQAETIPDVADPAGPEARAQADALEDELRRQVGAQDFDVPLDPLTGEARAASEILDEIDRDRVFAEQLQTVCRT